MPESVTSLNHYAGALYQVGELARATAALERALAISPKLANTHYNLGVLLRSGPVAVRHAPMRRCYGSIRAGRLRGTALRGEAHRQLKQACVT